MSATKKVVLVVDDTPANLQLVTALLRGKYQVKAAKSGTRALQIAAADPPPDLVILDVMMPEMDGYEVCRRLQGDPATAAIPVIFLTGHPDESERERALVLGAAGYICKPVDPDELRAQVASCVDSL